jgi:hypothetical protein
LFYTFSEVRFELEISLDRDFEHRISILLGELYPLGLLPGGLEAFIIFAHFILSVKIVPIRRIELRVALKHATTGSSHSKVYCGLVGVFLTFYVVVSSLETFR